MTAASRNDSVTSTTLVRDPHLQATPGSLLPVLFVDPDPAACFNADPDSAGFFNADPDPVKKRLKNTVPVPHEEFSVVGKTQKDGSKVNKTLSWSKFT